MSEYKLSIIIPTFNLENEIDNAFNSIKNQTIGFENIEVIFVDDNSASGVLLKDFFLSGEEITDRLKIRTGHGNDFRHRLLRQVGDIQESAYGDSVR